MPPMKQLSGDKLNTGLAITCLIIQGFSNFEFVYKIRARRINFSIYNINDVRLDWCQNPISFVIIGRITMTIIIITQWGINQQINREAYRLLAKERDRIN